MGPIAQLLAVVDRGLRYVGYGLMILGLVACVAPLLSGIAIAIVVDSFYFAYGTLFVIAISVFVRPLLVFVPTLMQLKRRAGLEYGRLASEYTQRFERKWIRREDPPGEEILGTGGIQSLADLGNSYGLIKKMRIVPITLPDLVTMAIPGMIPAIPLAAFVMPVTDIVKTFLHLLA